MSSTADCKRWKRVQNIHSALYWPTGIHGAVRFFQSKLSVGLGALAFGLIAGVSQADWPEFRGPSQNGTASVASLPLEWSAEPGREKNIVWQTPTEGLGWSSPVIVGDRIYITSARPEPSDAGKTSGAQSLILSIYDVDSGTLIAHRTLFQQPADAPDIHKKTRTPAPLWSRTKVASMFTSAIKVPHAPTSRAIFSGAIATTRTLPFTATAGPRSSSAIV